MRKMRLIILGKKLSREGVSFDDMGGEHDIDEEVHDISEEDVLYTSPLRPARMTLSEVMVILRRDDEVAAAKKRGCHRESDMQMKAFLAKYEADITTLLSEQKFAIRIDGSAKLLGNNPSEVLQYQQALVNAMKRDQHDLKHDLEASPDMNDVDAVVAALANLKLQDSVEQCVTLPLPDIMKGPKHVANLIVEEQRKKEQPLVLNEEQKDLFAFWVDKLKQAFDRRPDPAVPDLCLETWLFDMIIDGGGGCGKTMLINNFIVPLCKAFFNQQGVVLSAPSNKAARGIHAKTLHSLLGFTPESSLRTAALALSSQKRVKLERTFLQAGVMLHDEHSMLAGKMNHAASLVTTYARETKFRLRREDYALPRERYGRMPILAYFGDHLQLPPVPQKNSMMASLTGTGQEHRVGTAIFRQSQYVFHMEKMMRFKDAVLIRILNTMREVDGKPLMDSDWRALLATELPDNTSHASRPDVTGWYTTSYVWSVVTMASFMEALKSARAAQKVLFYIQAVDVPLNHAASSEADAQRLHRALLQVPSLSQTKRLPAFCLLHIGMQVRLTTTLHQPYAVQDATATVLEIHFADNDAQAHQHMRGAKHVDVLLDLLPVAVLIQLHDCKHVFLPVGPCSRCSSFADNCQDCQDERRKLEGVFAVEPLAPTWKYKTSDGTTINVKRRQMPLAPAKVLSLYSMQGMTAEPGLVAHWVLPKQSSRDIKWLIVYVIFSRVPSLKQLVSIGLTDKIRDIIEGGPPQELVQTFSNLFDDKIKSTKAAAKEARQRLGW